MFYRILLLFIFTLSFQLFYAQQSKKTVIKLDNPSFEGVPRASANLISGWRDCGSMKFSRESPPDLQPGHFLVDIKPQHGNTYLGMVTRDNDTWESVCQQLRTPLKTGTCYNFSLYLASSPTYKSPVLPFGSTRRGGVAAEEAALNGEKLDSLEFTQPIVLKIWGGTSQCAKNQLLSETEKITNQEWQKFDFMFEPKDEYDFIVLEAHFKTPALFTPNGHILIDNLSDIVGVPCSMEPPLVKMTKPNKKASTKEDVYPVKATLDNVYSKADVIMSLNDRKFTDFKFDVATGAFSANIPLKKGNNKLVLKGRNSEGEDSKTSIIRKIDEEQEIVAVVTDPKPKEPVKSPKQDQNSLEGIEKKDLKKNQKLEIKNIAFDTDSYEIKETYQSTLDKISNFMKSNSDVVIEIGGHTNNRCDEEFCIKLSENRAKAVMNYLIDEGVHPSRLKSKGYGSVEPIKSNNSEYGRRRNQRVEIKILEIQG